MASKTKVQAAEILYYRAGGNPPQIPALYLGTTRIAWWPAAITRPDQAIASRVLIAYEAKGACLTREEVVALSGPEKSDDA